MKITIQSDVFVIIGLTLVLAIAMILIAKKIDKCDPYKKPKGIVLLMLWLFDTLDHQVVDNVGKKRSTNLSPYIVSIAIYIFTSNILGLFGLSSPTSNYSVTLTLAIITWVMVQEAQFSANGVKGYFHAFIEPIPAFLPMNIFGKFSTLLSMSLRLFGNILCGGIIMQLVYSFTAYLSTSLVSLVFSGSTTVFNFVGPLLAPVLHAYFDVFAGFIQTLIFITLTMVLVGNELPDEMKKS